MLPNMGGDVWARLVPGSIRPWVVAGIDPVGTVATATGTVPVGMAGVITSIRGCVGYSATAALTKVFELDWTKCEAEVTVAGLSWTIEGSLLVPGPTSYLSQPVVTLSQAQVWFELPLPAPIVLTQTQELSIVTGGVWPTGTAVLQVWGIGYLGTPGPGK